MLAVVLLLSQQKIITIIKSTSIMTLKHVNYYFICLLNVTKYINAAGKNTF